VNELELIASLRDEVPLTASSRVEHAVLAEIAASRKHAPGGSRRNRASQPGRGWASRRSRRLALRPVIGRLRGRGPIWLGQAGRHRHGGVVRPADGTVAEHRSPELRPGDQ
jgi:hypothetical protein